jgi:hypothetical protein
MFQIDDTIVSSAIVEKNFVCDLESCCGSCCRYGDSGAPLHPEEALALEKLLPLFSPWLRPEGIKAIEEKGTSVRDIEGDTVTPLIGNEECAYTVIENGIYRCAIEMAFTAGVIGFRKPLSCHLFPVRIKNFTDFRAVNYEEWPICRPALAAGENEKTQLYTFLKEPLIRAFGHEWYDKLVDAANEHNKEQRQWNR